MSDRGTPGKPSNTEDEYFVREDAEKKRKIALQAKKETQAAELARLKALHWLRCPKCGLEMQVVKYNQHDVEVCFACKGIFLDEGELESIVKREKSGVMGAVLNWFKPAAD
ncbi:MAG: zf-TFIIB domain-containing protein [Anaeromyxobacter sp.]|nr:zf-TFIIB domain-containing protein [Anaeromyxobacter sp.]MBL0277027.1 zf-TFIIB domain-containing protein [Anaeromyxobacter sp.]